MSPFRERPVAEQINGGCRLNLRHGPIDLIVEAEGSGAEISQAYNQATAAFENVLTDLVGELDLLRTPVTDTTPVPRGLIARRMRHAAPLTRIALSHRWLLWRALWRIIFLVR